MIVSQREIHHRTNNDLAVQRDGPLLNCVHSENSALGWIDDRRGKQRPVNAAVADRKSSALQLFEGKFVFLRFLRELTNRLFDLREAHAFGISQDWNDQ